VIVREVSDVKARGFLPRRGDERVESEIGEYEIGTFVAVDVGNGDRVPTPIRCCESRLGCSFDESTSFLMSRLVSAPQSSSRSRYIRTLTICVLQPDARVRAGGHRPAIFRYIETWYNRERWHSTLDHVSWAQYQARLQKTA
jgi:hypothetical protein